MIHSAQQNGETVDVHDIMETDIFQLLMRQDRIEPTDFFALCLAKRQELGGNAKAYSSFELL